MVYLISILISFLIINFYVKRKRSLALKGLLLCALSWFEPNLDAIGLDYITIRAIGQNSYFLSLVCILLYDLRRKVNGGQRYSVIEKIAFLLFAYASIIAFYTIVTGKESIFNVFALLKPYVFLLAIFVVNRIPKEDCESTIRLVYKSTIVLGVIAIAQVLFGFELFGKMALEYNEGIDRYWSPYPTATLCLFISLIFPPKKFSVFYFVFFLALVFLPLRRGIIASTILTLGIYYLYQFFHGHLNKSILGVALIILISLPLLINRFSSEGDNVSEDLSSVTSGQTDYSNFRNSGGGSTAFRLLILVERIEYLVNNPEYLLTGVGLIHEDTAQKQFDFFLGSKKSIKGEVTIMQIDNGDIVWPPILMRVGLIGLLLYLLLFFKLLMCYFKRIKYSKWALVGVMFLFSFILFSIADSQLVEPYSFLLYFMIYKIVKEKGEVEQLVVKAQ